MKFTYNEYEFLLDLLKANNYQFCNFVNYLEHRKCAILRHDIDFDLNKALELARIENLKGINSTYFILLSTDFYNVFSKESFEIVKKIKRLGHYIGLHFDEKRYGITDFNSLDFYVNYEKSVLENLLGYEIQVVSMHRPSKWILENDINLNNIVNTYTNCFLREFKYVSDSRMFWRENVLDIIRDGCYNKLHILVHPFWYSNQEETMRNKLVNFIKGSRIDRYNYIKGNFKNIEDIISADDIILK